MMRSGYVTIVGRPNTGKSTLLNSIMKVKLSAVSMKAQTTRAAIQGIFMDEESQIIFYDTPGLIVTKNHMEDMMMRDINETVKSSDIIVFMCDDRNYEEILDLNIKSDSIKVALLNKIDRMSENKVIEITGFLKNSGFYNEVLSISALKNKNIDDFIKILKKYLPYDHAFYPEDILTGKPERFFVAEFVRQATFDLYGEEIPYSTGIIVDEFKEREGNKDYIRVKLLVERESQKGIIIGAGGKMIKQLGIRARVEIETFLERPVYLEVFVKVQKDWKDNKQIISRMWEQM